MQRDADQQALVWENITVVARDASGSSKQVLRGVSGSAPAGQLVGLLGPSGSGKSSLLEVLAAGGCSRRGRGAELVAGQVSLPGLATPPGGNPATSARAPRHHQPAVAYVAQSTPLHGHLTVRETLRYTALLVLGPDLGRAAAEQRAEALLHELGLTAAADTFVGTWYLRGISGGEHQRLAMACELLSSPSVLLLDEPTSGLDAAAAYHVVATMKRLAAGGGWGEEAATGGCSSRTPGDDNAPSDRHLLVAGGPGGAAGESPSMAVELQAAAARGPSHPRASSHTQLPHGQQSAPSGSGRLSLTPWQHSSNSTTCCVPPQPAATQQYSGAAAPATEHSQQAASSRQPRVVVAALHQPSAEVAEQLDLLLVLARGQVVYSGSPAGLEVALVAAGLACPPRRHPADHLLHCISTDFALQQDWPSNGDGSASAASTSTGGSPGTATDQAIAALQALHAVQHEPQALPAPPTSPATTPSDTPTATITTAPDGSTLALATAPPSHASAPTHKQPRQHPHHQHHSHAHTATTTTGCSCSALLHWCLQVAVLLSRFMTLNRRNVPLYWVRLVTFLLQCACCGTLFWRLGDSWADVQARAGLLFFVVASLSFMAIATAPAAVDDLKVSQREREAGRYSPSAYALAESLAAAPFVLLLALASALPLYYTAGLAPGLDRLLYFVLALFLALYAADSLMAALCVLVPHFLMGLLAGAGLIGISILTCGFFLPPDRIPAPLWRYPLHYLNFITYAFAGLMNNEFEGSGARWQCPCLLQGLDCSPSCRIPGRLVLEHFAADRYSRGQALALLAAFVVGHRLLLVAALLVRDRLGRRRRGA